MKNDGKNKLSICIPTYNRCADLENCLDSILVLSPDLLERIEILISDNFSPDGTFDLVRSKYTNKHKNIKYVRLEKNIGAEGNFLNAIANSSGEYIWVFGDDDMLEINEIKKIEYILNSDNDIMVVNYSLWNDTLTKMTKGRAFNARNERSYSSDDLMISFGPTLSFISCVIFKKSLFDRVPIISYEKLSRTGFSFLYATYYMARLAKSIVFIDSPIVRNRVLDSAKYNWDDYFISGLHSALKEILLLGYSKKAIKRAQEQVVFKYIGPKLRQRKILNQPLSGNIGELFGIFGKTLNFWFGVFPLFFLPGSIVRFVLHVKNIVSR